MIKINVCLIETEFQLLHSKLLFAFRVRQAKFSRRETAWRSFIQSHHLFFVLFCFVLIQTSQRFGGVFLDWFCGIFFVLFGFISIKGHRSYAGSGRSFPQVVTVGTTSRFLNSLQNSAPSQEFSLIWGLSMVGDGYLGERSGISGDRSSPLAPHTFSAITEPARRGGSPCLEWVPCPICTGLLTFPI